MLWVGLTGGIGAGKSAVSRLLAQHGAVVLDADLVAREVLEVGTAGLGAVVEAFGPAVLRRDGALDREALGRLVFADDEARRRLNGIVHPRVERRTSELAEQAERTGAAVLVHDVPLLVENGMAPLYHLVLVVQAPLADRVHRLTAGRGMSPHDARARMSAQADDAARREVADVVLGNDAGLDALAERVTRLWDRRLVPYAENLRTARPASRGPVRLSGPDADWERAGRRLLDRLRAVCGPRAVHVEHIGSTAVRGLAARDVVDLQVEVTCRADAEALAAPLAAAGFPHRDDVTGEPARPEVDPDPGQWWRRLHLSADPGRPADVHVRLAGSASARAARALRDLLRADADARRRYEADKRRLAVLHADDVAAYREGKTPLLVPLLVRALAGGGTAA